jgi:pectin methylesterase-like acyl-CoA thioesterase
MLPKLRSQLTLALCLFSTCLAALLPAAAQAQTTRNVGQGQTYTTIQSAIDASTNGDIVLVYPGTYYENLDFKGKAITVTSTPAPAGGAANTIIDGLHLGSTV